MCRPYERVWILGRNIGSAGAAVVCAWSAGSTGAAWSASPAVATGLVGQVDFSTGAAWVGHALGGNPLGRRGRLLLRSGLVGHALGGDPPYQRGRRLLPPYAAESRNLT